MSSDEFIRNVIKSRGLILVVSRLDYEKATLRLVQHLREIKREGTKVVSLVGGAASGKSILAKRIASALQSSAVIGTDDFVLGSREYRAKYLEGGDPLRKYDFDLLKEKVDRIRNLQPGESEPVPVYDEEEGATIRITSFDPETGRIISIDRDDYLNRIGKVEYLIIEGDFQPLANPDCQIFYHVPDKVRLQNRINRDATQRNALNIKGIVESFELRQELQHLPYTLRCANHADLLITVDAIPVDEGYRYRHSFWAPPADGRSRVSPHKPQEDI